jgi:hypothetical protein
MGDSYDRDYADVAWAAVDRRARELYGAPVEVTGEDVADVVGYHWANLPSSMHDEYRAYAGRLNERLRARVTDRGVCVGQWWAYRYDSATQLCPWRVERVEGGIAHGRSLYGVEHFGEIKQMLGDPRYIRMDAHTELPREMLPYVPSAYDKQIEELNAELEKLRAAHEFGCKQVERLTTERDGLRASIAKMSDDRAAALRPATHSWNDGEWLYIVEYLSDFTDDDRATIERVARALPKQEMAIEVRDPHQGASDPAAKWVRRWEGTGSISCWVAYGAGATELAHGATLELPSKPLRITVRRADEFRGILSDAAKQTDVDKPRVEFYAGMSLRDRLEHVGDVIEVYASLLSVRWPNSLDHYKSDGLLANIICGDVTVEPAVGMRVQTQRGTYTIDRVTDTGVDFDGTYYMRSTFNAEVRSGRWAILAPMRSTGTDDTERALREEQDAHAMTAASLGEARAEIAKLRAHLGDALRQRDMSESQLRETRAEYDKTRANLEKSINLTERATAAAEKLAHELKQERDAHESTKNRVQTRIDDLNEQNERLLGTIADLSDRALVAEGGQARALAERDKYHEQLKQIRLALKDESGIDAYGVVCALKERADSAERERDRLRVQLADAEQRSAEFVQATTASLGRCKTGMDALREQLRLTEEARATWERTALDALGEADATIGAWREATGCETPADARALRERLEQAETRRADAEALAEQRGEVLDEALAAVECARAYAARLEEEWTDATGCGVPEKAQQWIEELVDGVRRAVERATEGASERERMRERLETTGKERNDFSNQLVAAREKLSSYGVPSFGAPDLHDLLQRIEWLACYYPKPVLALRSKSVSVSPQIGDVVFYRSDSSETTYPAMILWLGPDSRATLQVFGLYGGPGSRYDVERGNGPGQWRPRGEV